MTQTAKKIGVHSSAIYTWASKNPEFSDALIRARTYQAHCLMDRALEQLEDHIAAGDAKNGRQAVEAYIKLAERMAPSKYGTRFVQHSGEIETKISAEERNLRILEILAKTSPELFKEHVPQIIDISAEPARLLENFEPKAGERASPKTEAITDCNWEVA